MKPTPQSIDIMTCNFPKLAIYSKPVKMENAYSSDSVLLNMSNLHVLPSIFCVRITATILLS